MALFNPSRDDVRRFFMDSWKKHRQGSVLTPIEVMAVRCMEKHPEYHELLGCPDAALQDYTVEQGQTNPFLHLSMHLAIEEQLSIDSPKGIRSAYRQLAAKTDEHQAIHEIMECLGQVLWEAQRNQRPPDQERYISLLRQRSGL